MIFSVTGEEFRRRRRELNLRQYEIAAVMKVSANTVARWESGTHPVHEGLARLAFEVIALRRLRDSLAATPSRRVR